MPSVQQMQNTARQVQHTFRLACMPMLTDCLSSTEACGGRDVTWTRCDMTQWDCPLGYSKVNHRGPPLRTAPATKRYEGWVCRHAWWCPTHFRNRPVFALWAIYSWCCWYCCCIGVVQVLHEDARIYYFEGLLNPGRFRSAA
jgi:hypothetical protein